MVEANIGVNKSVGPDRQVWRFMAREETPRLGTINPKCTLDSPDPNPNELMYLL